MRRIILSVVVVLVAAMGIRILMNVFASEETQIRWRLEGLVERFNSAHNRGFMTGVAEDFSDEPTGFDRSQLRDLLRLLFLR